MKTTHKGKKYGKSFLIVSFKEVFFSIIKYAAKVIRHKTDHDKSTHLNEKMSK